MNGYYVALRSPYLYTIFDRGRAAPMAVFRVDAFSQPEQNSNALCCMHPVGFHRPRLKFERCSWDRFARLLLGQSC